MPPTVLQSNSGNAAQYVLSGTAVIRGKTTQRLVDLEEKVGAFELRIAQLKSLTDSLDQRAILLKEESARINNLVLAGFGAVVLAFIGLCADIFISRTLSDAWERQYQKFSGEVAELHQYVVDELKNNPGSVSNQVSRIQERIANMEGRFFQIDQQNENVR